MHQTLPILRQAFRGTRQYLPFHQSNTHKPSDDNAACLGTRPSLENRIELQLAFNSSVVKVGDEATISYKDLSGTTKTINTAVVDMEGTPAVILNTMAVGECFAEITVTVKAEGGDVVVKESVSYYAARTCNGIDAANYNNVQALAQAMMNFAKSAENCFAK